MLLIRYAEIRNTLVSGLHEYIKLLVIQQSSIGDQPTYPFITYNVSTPYMQLGKAEHYTELLEGVEVSKNIEHYEQVFSFTVAGKDEDEVIDLCMDAIQYFKLHGVQELKDKGIVIVNISNVSLRDNMITINYERRMGFDVRIRVACEEIHNNPDIIETANIKIGGNANV